MWREDDIDDDRRLASIMMPEFYHLAPNVEVEEQDRVHIPFGYAN